MKKRMHNWICGSMCLVTSAIELQIADVLESNDGAMTLSELSAAHLLPYRIMRYLMHRGIFKQVVRGQESSIYYVQMPLSRLLMKSGGNSIAALVFAGKQPCNVCSLA
ncbi:UNVERIFIED_CONTAM: hypothetical protein Scaly_3088500 [Sesamum calycinum]|uniref:O-methyltransferase dimerisation domain-containing protein n=1 Tax=Sesamum calycinum TaxID=2727403 RepID=A0AAW2JNZ3_9LAMI